MDPGFTGSVINALPIDRMISGPLQAMVAAQIQASRAYANFLTTVCFKNVKDDGGEYQVAKNIQFEYDETIVDHEGNFKEVHRKTMRIPLMAAITHPNICIEEGSVDFEMEVSQAEEEHKETAGEAALEAKAGWGPFSVKIHGKVSHKSEQTRKTDTRSKYSIHTLIKRQGPPEGLMRVIEFLTDAATKPVLLPNKVKKDLPTDSVEKITDEPEKKKGKE